MNHKAQNARPLLACGSSYCPWPRCGRVAVILPIVPYVGFVHVHTNHPNIFALRPHPRPPQVLTKTDGGFLVLSRITPTVPPIGHCVHVHIQVGCGVEGEGVQDVIVDLQCRGQVRGGGKGGRQSAAVGMVGQGARRKTSRVQPARREEAREGARDTGQGGGKGQG